MLSDSTTKIDYNKEGLELIYDSWVSTDLSVSIKTTTTTINPEAVT